MLVAVTGATGFLGRPLVRELAAQGLAVRILARRDPICAEWRGLAPEVVVGSLGDEGALRALTNSVDVVIHAAGLVKARTAAEFTVANADGARRVAAATSGRMLLVSSLAAREPQLSAYAASKRAGEDAARAVLGERLTIVRPPAIYGPGDRELLPLFQTAARSPVLPVFSDQARTAVIHIDDAARQIAALARRSGGGTFALSDHRPEGYGWREIMREAAAAVGRRPRLVPTPAPVVHGVARLAGFLGGFGGVPMLTAGKARELLHDDWSLRPEEQAQGLPPPQFGLSAGLADAVRWYRARNWL
ncbi:NAD-dependent epimerase/dehydratase family protein [Phenylobacterium sp.]|uniref:NAD-dependent epimerase/dehydratase family protein n=1 Tax=Phenylobacterium sp. TaxID=1871053 RepID=UPI003783AFB6